MDAGAEARVITQVLGAVSDIGKVLYNSTQRIIILKEKFPQAFLCRLGEWRMILETKTAKVWVNLDNPVKRYDFFKGFINFCVYCPLRWHSSRICDVTTVQLSNGNCTQIFLLNFYFSWKCNFPLLSYLSMLGLWWMFHAFMNELDQKDYWYPRKNKKKMKNLCTKSMESCPIVISHVLAEFHPERATYTTLHNHFS